VLRNLESLGCRKLLLRERSELDLVDQHSVRHFFQSQKPDYVFLAAARVGGIVANNLYPAQFIYENLMIAANVIEAAYQAGTRRLIFLGSSCIYPRLAPQPMKEDVLLTGHLEATNEPYAVAKIAGIKLCESFNREFDTDFRSVMPCNLYGGNDNFELKTSHVLPALVRKFHEAKESGAESVEVWGTGIPRREFLHVEDLARAVVFVMCLSQESYREVTKPSMSHINVGVGTDVTIRELAIMIKDIVGFNGDLEFNPAYPDGTERKLLDISKLESLGWAPKISLQEGISATYAWYRNSIDEGTLHN